MKVVIIIDTLATGGAEQQAAILAAELARRGVEVHFLANYERNDFSELFLRNGVKHVLIGKGPLFGLPRIGSMVRYLRRERFDVVHCFKSHQSSYGRLAGRMAGAPRVFGGFQQRHSDSTLCTFLNRWMGFGADGWIVNSQCGKETVVKDMHVDPATVFVVRNVIGSEWSRRPTEKALARQALGLPPTVPVVTLVANLRPEKNHGMFLNVAQEVLKEEARAVFLCAGEGPEEPRVRRSVQEMGLQEHVRLLGRVSDVPLLLSATDVAVLTSTTEGCPNTIVEAACAGVPCVSTDNGGATEVITDGVSGMIVPVNDHVEMAKRIVTLLRNEDVRKKIVDSARGQALVRFSLETNIETLLAVYRFQSEDSSHQQEFRNSGSAQIDKIA